MTRLARLTALLLVAVACRRDDAPAASDSVAVTPVPPAPVPVVTAAALGWDDAVAGPALFVSSANGALLEVVVPGVTDSTFGDSSSYARLPLGGVQQVELFSRAGRVGAVRLPQAVALAGPGEMEGCVSWPTVRPLDPAPSPSLIGFAAGRAVALPLDSIEALARADSSRLAVEAALVASRIPNDTAVAFAGLPFVVRAAHRVRVAPDTEVLVADVVRRIGQEADPREQHVFIVAERPTAGGEWRLSWHERTSGAEDAAETRELLAAVRLGGVPVLVIAVTYPDGGSYGLLERVDGRWRERWSSAYTGC